MRQDNIEMFQDTMRILEQGYYTIGNQRIELKLSRTQMEAADVYLPGDIQIMSGNKDFQHVHVIGRCGYGCENADSFSLAGKRMEQFSCDSGRKDAKPILVLNLANAVSPGGGVRRGAKAQEEDLCRKSSLLLSLESRNARPYYEYNKSLHTDMGSDAIIINPQVEIIKDENGNLLPDTAVVAVMTCAAPRFRNGMEGISQSEYESLMYQRITGMLKTAAYLGYRHLVLGAFGCGAFHNDARVVSDLFYKALKEFDYDGMKEKDMFRRIDFAVMDHSADQYNFKEFSRNFSNFYRDEDQAEIDRASEKKKDNSMRPPARQLPFVFFWKDNEENGYLSNWYRRKFVIDDFEYLHVDQYMMAQKAKLFHDSARYTAILRATNPWECKDLGRQVTPFDAKTWNAVKYDVVKDGNRAKYEQNPDLKKLLLATGNAVLAEASPKDKVWGIGLDAQTAASTDMSEWPGQGLLGLALMELRTEFSGEANKETELRMVKGDITKVSDVEAIVNAANKSLLGGGGVDGAIHRAAGPKLLEECRTLHGCNTGEAKITKAYDLPCKYVIHTVGPVWNGGKRKEAQLLADCYRNSLQAAIDNGIRSVAFPSISTGVYSYPLKEAAEIAVTAVNEFIEEHPGELDLIEWVLFDRNTFNVYDQALGQQKRVRRGN